MKANVKWLKYYLIIMYGLATNKSCVNLFGSTWLIAGNMVKKIR